MNVKSIYKHVVLIMLVLLLAMPRVVMSQVMEFKRGVDTLSIADRIALRSNIVDWALTTPNIGVEFDVRNTNWNRWSVGLNFKYNWQAKHTYNPGVVYNIAETKLEVRNYWRYKQNAKVTYKKRTYTFYRGLYLAYDKFSLMLSGSGSQGKAISGGVSLGVIKPFYNFKNGNSMDFELGASAGICYAKYDKYRLDRESNCYPVTEVGKTAILPMVNDIRVSLVYRFGNYPITKKYRWRIEADRDYYQRLIIERDSIEQANERKILETNNNNSIINEFSAAYDSLLVIVMKQEAEKQKQETLKRNAAPKAPAANVKPTTKDTVEAKPVAQDSVEVKPIQHDTVAVEPVKHDTVVVEPVAPVSEESKTEDESVNEAKSAEDNPEGSNPAGGNQDNDAVVSDEDNNGKEAKDE